MRVLPVGRHAVLVEVDDLAAVLGLRAALGRAPLPGVVDVVPAARTLLLVLDEAVPLAYDAVAAALRALPVTAGELPPGGDPVELPVTYDGPDLAEVAQLTGLDEAEVVRRHSGTAYVVAFAGFAPGFGYLVPAGGGEPPLPVARRDSPRTRVPAGSVAVAGEFTGVYPREGPGGWQLLGRTDAPLWDLERDPPALLAPGTRVRFVAVAR